MAEEEEAAVEEEEDLADSDQEVETPQEDIDHQGEMVLQEDTDHLDQVINVFLDKYIFY